MRASKRQHLIERIESLTEESYSLPASPAGWKRREAIEWELIVLFRQIATLSDGPPPYWAPSPPGVSHRQPAPDRPPHSPSLSIRELIYGPAAGDDAVST